MKKIEIIVSPEGKTTVETTGFTGPSCQDASRFVEHALGQPTGERLTPEFYETDSIQQTHQQRT